MFSMNLWGIPGGRAVNYPSANHAPSYDSTLFQNTQWLILGRQPLPGIWHVPERKLWEGQGVQQDRVASPLLLKATMLPL